MTTLEAALEQLILESMEIRGDKRPIECAQWATALLGWNGDGGLSYRRVAHELSDGWSVEGVRKCITSIMDSPHIKGIAKNTKLTATQRAAMRVVAAAMAHVRALAPCAAVDIECALREHRLTERDNFNVRGVLTAAAYLGLTKPADNYQVGSVKGERRVQLAKPADTRSNAMASPSLSALMTQSHAAQRKQSDPIIVWAHYACRTPSVMSFRAFCLLYEDRYRAKTRRITPNTVAEIMAGAPDIKWLGNGQYFSAGDPFRSRIAVVVARVFAHYDCVKMSVLLNVINRAMQPQSCPERTPDAIRREFLEVNNLIIVDKGYAYPIRGAHSDALNKSRVLEADTEIFKCVTQVPHHEATTKTIQMHSGQLGIPTNRVAFHLMSCPVVFPIRKGLYGSLLHPEVIAIADHAAKMAPPP